MDVDLRDLDYGRRSSPPPFLLKTHTLVEDPATDEIISWNQEGTTFVVWQPAEFARDLLPKLFKHSNFSSFVRQLNTYGFRKASSGRWEFQNENFQRGERDLLCEIRRRKAWTSTGKNMYTSSTKTQPFDQLDEDDQDRGSSSSSSTSSDYVNLREENARLKRENSVLYSELVGVKKRCRDLLDLVGIYAKSDEAEKDQRPKLFGVRLEVQPEKKRKRLEMSEALHLMLSQA